MVMFKVYFVLAPCHSLLLASYGVFAVTRSVLYGICIQYQGSFTALIGYRTQGINHCSMLSLLLSLDLFLFLCETVFRSIVWIKPGVSNICRCVLLSFDDGTLRILSLVKVAYDVPATGKPYPNTKQQGLSVYNCSTYPIWSIQVSRLTGM